MIWVLHGNLGGPEDWAATLEYLAPCRLRVVAPCLWERAPEEFSPWAESFLDRAEGGGEPRVLMGYSLGARLGMHALLARPAVWAAAVFVSGHPGLEDPGERSRRRQDDLAWAERLRNEPIRDFARAWNGQSVFAGEKPCPSQLGVLEKHREAIERAFDVWSLGRQAAFSERLRACSVPQLWIAGGRDAKFAALARGMAGEHATAVVLDDCGHRVPLQKPRELAECVRFFLKGKLEI